MTTSDPSSQAAVVWQHNLEYADQIIQCIEEGRYCALLGPRFWGKSNLLRYVQGWMQEHSLPYVHINLFEIQAPTQVDFFSALARNIAESVAGYSGRAPQVPSEEFSSAAFRDFLSQCVDHLGMNLAVIFDHLEGLPADLISALLTSLRALHMEQQDKDLRFVAIVSGALSLAARTVGETSPFHGIAHRLILGDLDLANSEALVATYSGTQDVHVSGPAQSLLLEETRGNPNLIKLICKRSGQIAAENPSRLVTTQTVNRVVREFLRVDAASYGPLQEAIRLVEEDPDLLRCVLKLLKDGTVPRRELPLPLVPDLDPLYLTGLVERVGAENYRIRNGIYRRYLSTFFDAAHAGNLLTLSGRWDAAIGHLEESILSGNNDSRQDLLAATINAMYAAETPEQAAYYILRGLSAAFGVSQISIWLLDRDGQTLDLLDQKGTTFEGGLPVDTQEISIHADRIEARSFRQVGILREIQDDTCTRYVIPLMVPGQSPVGVVTLSDCGREETVTEYRRREFQLQSYLNQAGRALHEVEFRQKRETRASEQDAQLDQQTRQLFLLHRISTLSQTIPDLEKVSHLILTAITANFGLGFNRAWLFLIDREKKALIGRLGIGSFTEEQAYQSWSCPPAFDQYVDLLIRNQIKTGGIDPLTRTLSLPISETSHDLFSMTVSQHHPFHWSGSPGHWHALPQEFRQAFEPGEMILTPLVVHNNCLGLIAVDNKFRPRPHTETDDLLLKTFANQMATAIFNIQQHEQEAKRLKLEEILRETSRAISSSLEQKEVLHRILNEMKKVLPFDSASIQLSNEETESLKIIAAIGFDDPEQVETLVFPLKGSYPNVLVYESKAPLHLKDVQERFANFGDPYYQVTEIHGWLGAPLIINNRVIGVITLDSKTPGIYTSEHDRMAVLFAGQASVAIENARLYEAEKQTREYLDLLISSSQDGIIAVDNKGKVIRYSDGAQKILGYSQEEIRQKRVDELYGSIDVAREINSRLRESEQLRDFPTSILDIESQPVPIVLSASLLRDRDGKPFGSVGFFKDMRPLKKVENNLRMILDTVNVMSEVDQSGEGLFALAKRIVTAQPVTFCSILLLDESKQNLIVKAAYPIPRHSGTAVRWDPVVGRSIPILYEGIMSYLVNLPAPQVFQQGERIKELDVIQHIHQNISVYDEIRSTLVVPLRAGNKVYGICILGETRSWRRSPFDEEKVEIIGSMVTQGMVFVDRLQAHEITENKLEMVVRLRSIGDDLVEASSASAKSILDKVVQAAYEVMGASNAIIYPWNQETKSYETDKIAHFGLRTNKNYSDKKRYKENSMTQVVLRKGMVIADDIGKGFDRAGETPIQVDPGKFLENERVQAFVGVSLRGTEGSYGALFVNFSEPHYFSESEIETVNLFANQAVMAIENAHLYEDLGQRLDESQTLQQVGMFLAENRDLNQVLDRVLRAAFELIHADTGNILFYEASRDEFLDLALTSSDKDMPLQPYRTQVRQKTGYSYEIIKNRKPIRVYDTRLDPSINPVMLEKGRRSVLGVPLIGSKNPVGVLWVHWKTVHLITDREERLLLALAGQAAVSIENVRLFDELTIENARRTEESQTLQKIGISLTESLDPDKVLLQVLLAALELVNGDEDTILFYDKSKDEFEMEALGCKGLDQPLDRYQTRVRQKDGIAYLIVHDREPVLIPDTLLDDRISPVAVEKGRRATVGVPLLDHDGPVGVLWVNWRQPRQISSKEASLLTALASQATVAITGARRYDELKRRTAHLEAVNKAGKVISAASVGMDRQQVLDQILEQAIECITGISGPKATMGTIQLVEEDTRELTVKSVFPMPYPQSSIDKFDHISLHPLRPHPGRIGISGRAVLSGEAQLVPDVSKNDDYIMHDENTQSEVAVPIWDDGKVIGVMDLESDKLNGFDELDRYALKMLVDLAVVALKNERQFRMQGERQSRELVAQMATGIIHDVNNLISNIPGVVGELRNELRGSRNDAAIEEYLLDLQNSATQTHRISSRLRDFVVRREFKPISYELGLLIKKVINDLETAKPDHIEIEFIQSPPLHNIQIDPLWVEALFSNLLHNAFEAIPPSRKGRILIKSWLDQNNILATIQDNGNGIPKDLLEKIFQPGFTTKGDPTRLHGIGLYFCQEVVFAHHGQINVQSIPGSETTFTVMFPASENIKEGSSLVQ